MNQTIMVVVISLVLASLIGYEIWAWIQARRRWRSERQHSLIGHFGPRVLSSVSILILVIYVILGLTLGNTPTVKSMGIAATVLISASILTTLGELIWAGCHYLREKKNKS